MTEWLLAFDAGCGTCSNVIARISTVVEDRLAVVNLGDERIRTLRRQALGEHPPFAPTLLKVDGGHVRVWTGFAMSVRLSRLLGPARSFKVIRALNQADVIVHGSRRRFLKTVPAVALGAFLLSGGRAAPAMASPGRQMTAAEANEWAAGLNPLPTAYREVTALSMVQRRAVYARSSAQTKASLWLENLRQYRIAHPGLSTAQSAVLDDVAATVPSIVTATGTAKTADTARLQDKAVAVLGLPGAAAAFGVLGQAESVSDGAPAHPQWRIKCDCHIGFSGCSSCGTSVECDQVSTGCGWLWSDVCDGVCGG
jgi:hypothetical protein